jgi:hypothetical protein
MLNEKQFRERAARELREIGNQVSGLATDREVFRRAESEVLQPAAEAGGSIFGDVFRGVYADAMTMRLRRLLATESSLSLRRVVDQTVDYPDLLHQKVNLREVADDSGELVKMATFLKEQIEPHFLPRERTLGALAPTLRELDRILDQLSALLQKYYWVVCDGYLNLDPKLSSDPLQVLRKG